MLGLNETAKERLLMLADALESGKYRQIQHQLHYPGFGFCAVGVACDVVTKHTNKSWDDMESNVVQPDFVDDWFSGNTTDKESIIVSSIFDDIMGLNDDDEASFDQIARWLRDHLNGKPVSIRDIMAENSNDVTLCIA